MWLDNTGETKATVVIMVSAETLPPEYMFTTVTAVVTAAPWALSQAQDPPLHLLSSVPRQDPQQQRPVSSVGSSWQD